MLHESVQRRICRIAFLAGCVLPTLLVLYSLARVWTPGYSCQWEAPLGQLLDCTVSVEAFRLPRPGVVQFKRLVLSDPETGATWARLDGVSHRVRQGRICVVIARAEVNCSTLPESSDHIARLLRPAAQNQMELTIAEAALLQGDASWKIADVHVHVAESENGRRLQIWSESNSSGPRLLVERDRQRQTPATRVTFQTGMEPLPCWAIAFLDRFDPLGLEARFQGRIDVLASRDTRQGNLSGRFSQLSISSELALGEPAPAQLDVNNLCWNNGRAGAFAGSIHPGPVAALLAHVQLVADPPLADEANAWSAPPGDVAWELGFLQSRPQAVKVAREDQHFIR